jgi:hypothetical protein
MRDFAVLMVCMLAGAHCRIRVCRGRYMAKLCAAAYLFPKSGVETLHVLLSTCLPPDLMLTPVVTDMLGAIKSHRLNNECCQGLELKLSLCIAAACIS